MDVVSLNSTEWNNYYHAPGLPIVRGWRELLDATGDDIWTIVSKNEKVDKRISSRCSDVIAAVLNEVYAVQIAHSSDKPGSIMWFTKDGAKLRIRKQVKRKRKKESKIGKRNLNIHWNILPACTFYKKCRLQLNEWICRVCGSLVSRKLLQACWILGLLRTREISRGWVLECLGVPDG